jgi:predicted nucleic acid-binding protein
VKVLVDTSVWSLALRRSGALSPENQVAVAELNELIGEVRVAMIGPIRQELLSGISSAEQFDALREKLRAFDDLALTQTDHEKAAEFYNVCRKAGIQGSHTDFLICAVAASRGFAIFTCDNDFIRYAGHLSISLHHPARPKRSGPERPPKRG